MTFDARKILPRQEIVQKISIFLDGCKYATPAALAARNMVTDSGDSLHATDPGDVLTLFTGSTSLFGSEVYIRMPSGEVLSADVDTATQVTVTARGLFGTTPAANSGSMICTMMHLGEADGSCYGFPQTCSSADSYDATVKREIVFATAPLEAGAIYTNGLVRDSIKREGPEVHPGRDIGTRARLTFTIDDEDDEIDQLNPYRDRIRPDGQKLAKLIESCPYWDNRKTEFSEGLRDAGTFDEPDYQVRGYVVDTFNLDNGQLKVSCLDPLILTEDKKSKTPPASEGKLSAAITGTPSTFTYVGAEDYHYGAASSTTYVRIDSEVIVCTVTGVKTLTVTTRGYRSETKDHSSGATIQLCDVFETMHVIDAIVWILENRTTVPAAYIDDYSATIALTPSAELTEAILSKPTESAQRINDLIRIGNLVFYFDEITQLIVIDYYPELAIEPISIDDISHIGKESIVVDRNQKQQYTRFTYSWAPYDVTKDSDEYFEFVHTGINATLESPVYMGAPNERPAEKTVFLTDDSADSVLGVAYVSRMLDQSAELPKILTLKLDAESIGETQGGTLAPGKIISVETQSLIDKTGASVSQLFQVERISGTLATGYTLKARRYVTIEPDDIDYTITAGTYVNYDLADHYAPAAGHYVVYIEPGAIFGSYSTATPAFTTGTQTSGVTFSFIHRGQMVGMGGAGGDGASIDETSSSPAPGVVSDSGQDGFDGGPAFNATVDCDIDCGSGLIWAGAGGQGGGSSAGNFTVGPIWSDRAPGAGGQGGRGFGPSAGGDAGDVDGNSGTDGANGGMTSGAGDFGEAGERPITNRITEPGRSYGGDPGASIVSNGNTVTITAGDNPTNIRGPRI